MRSISGVEYDSVSQARSTPFSVVCPCSPKYIPPASSRTISRSRSPSRSAFRGEIPLSGSSSFTGRTSTYSPRPFRIEQSTLGALPDGQSIPLRPADRSQKYGVGFAAAVQRFIGKRRAGGIDGRAADRKLLELKLVIKFLRRFTQDGRCRPCDFRTDAVSW